MIVRLSPKENRLLFGEEPEIRRINRTRFRGTELSAAVKLSRAYMVYVAGNAMMFTKWDPKEASRECSRSITVNRPRFRCGNEIAEPFLKWLRGL